MDRFNDWERDPLEAYALWQKSDAAGVAGKPFAARSVVQHTAMFDRFLRHLLKHRVTVATFGTKHLDSFFAEVDNRCSPGSATQIRYLKLIDRLSRRLIDLGLRESNPAAEFAYAVAWPTEDPRLDYLSEAADRHLQKFVQPQPTDSLAQRRERAITALLLGTGITASELRSTQRGHLVLNRVRSHVDVPRCGPRPARRVPVANFSVAALEAWCNIHPVSERDSLLFPSPRGGAFTDMYLGRMIARVFDVIDIGRSSGGPRLLRNTYARRQLIAGRSDGDVAGLLGLVSPRTVSRIRATLPSTEHASVMRAALTSQHLP